MYVSHSSVLIMLSARPALFLIAQSQRWNGTIGIGVLPALCATGCSIAMAACLLLLEGSAHTHQAVHMELGCKVQCKNAEPGSCTSHACPSQGTTMADYTLPERQHTKHSMKSVYARKHTPQVC